MSSESLRVAVTGLNRGENPQPGCAVARSIRRAFPEARVIGLAYETLESGIYADENLDAVFTVPYPSSGPQAFLDRLDEILAQEPLDVFIPTLDTDTALAGELVEELRGRGVATALPSVEAVSRCGKAKLPHLAESVGIRTPVTQVVYSETEALEAARAIGYPVMVKGLHYEATRVYGQAELAQAFRHTRNRWGLPIILQEHLTGDEFNVVGVGDGRGGLVGACAIRKTVVSQLGKGFGAVTVSDPWLLRAAEALAKELQWAGPFELELLRTRDSGTFHLLEVNPRFPAWVDFAAAIGCNLPACVAQGARGRKIERLPAPAPGKFFLRHSVDVVGDMADLAKLSTSGGLTKRPNPIHS